MRKVLWILAGVGFVVWTLFVLTAWGTVGLFGDGLRNWGGYVPGFPVERFSVPWLVDLGTSFGGVAAFFGWLTGSMMIFSVPMIASFFGRRRKKDRWRDDRDDGRRDDRWRDERRDRRRDDDDDDRKRRRRDDDTPRFDQRSLRIPGIGRQSGPHGRSFEPDKLPKFARKLLVRLDRR